MEGFPDTTQETTAERQIEVGQLVFDPTTFWVGTVEGLQLDMRRPYAQLRERDAAGIIVRCDTAYLDQLRDSECTVADSADTVHWYWYPNRLPDHP